MNSCILMAEIVEAPQLRHVNNDNMMALSEMLVQFPGLRADDPPATLKVVGWGKLAEEIEQTYHKGDRVIIEGRLGMNTIPKDGYKEKRAELTVQKIHSLGAGVNESTLSSTTVTPQPSRTPEPAEPAKKQPAVVGVAAQSQSVKPASQPSSPLPTPDTDVDDIPF